MEERAYIEMASMEKEHWFWRGRRVVIRTVLDSLTLPDNPKILEVGAGTGGNLALLEEFGVVTAVEMNETARAHANKYSKVKVFEGYLPDNLPIKDKKFNLICLFDVLEHIEDAVAALEVLKAHLKPSGMIIITVPAYQWMWSDWDETLHHFRRYTIKSLHDELQNAGMVPVKSSYFNTLLFPIAALVRVTSKLFRLEGAVGTALPSKFINNFLFAIFRLERTFIRMGNLPFGLSVLAIATRTDSKLNNFDVQK